MTRRQPNDQTVIRAAIGVADRAAAEAVELRQIILDLFAPNTGHKSGCLTWQRGPCQCGFSDVQIRYNSALRRAKEIAAEHYAGGTDGLHRDTAK